MGCGYLLLVALKHETFFFNQPGETIQLIQILEGVMNLTAYLFGPAFLAIGLTCLDFIYKTLKDGNTCREAPDIAAAAGLLYSAGWGPMFVVCIASGLIGFLSGFLRLSTNVFGGEPGSFMDSPVGHLITIVFIVIIFIPFLYLSREVRRTLGLYLTFKTRKLEVPDPQALFFKFFKLNDILAGTWYVAECSDSLAIPLESSSSMSAERTNGATGIAEGSGTAET
jgi:hypothetical protein